MKHSPDYVPRKYLSVSTLVSFARCPRKYFYEKSGLRSEDLMIAANYGTAMHFAVPVALETEDVKLAMDAFVSSWIETEEQMDGRGMEDKKRNRRCAERSLTHFIFTHKGSKSIYKLVPPPTGGIETDSRTSSFEVPWALDIGLRVPLVGRIDSMCRHRDTGGSWVWELKTSSSKIGSSFFDAHEMYIQNLTYTLVSQTVLDEPSEGVMLEGVHVSDKTVDNAVQMIAVQQHHLEDVLKWLILTGGRLLACEDEIAKNPDNPELPFGKDFTGCTPYTHFYRPGWRCDFADLCRVPDWRMLTDLYKVVPDHDFLNVTVDPDATRKVKPIS